MAAMIGPLKVVSLVILLSFSSCLKAQSSGWDAVKRLPSGQKIRIAQTGHKLTCSFVSADEDSLVCIEKKRIFFVPAQHRMVISRADVRWIRFSRQELSTVAGLAIGAGAGAGIGAGIDASAKSKEDDGLATVLFALLGGMLGSGIGHGTDFLSGPLVYQAP